MSGNSHMSGMRIHGIHGSLLRDFDEDPGISPGGPLVERVLTAI